MLVIDADAHVEEGVEAWRYLDPTFHSRRPIPVTLPEDALYRDRNALWLIDRKVRLSTASFGRGGRAWKSATSAGSQELTDVGARLADLDALGVEKQVLYPSLWLGGLAEDVELEAALARSYNQFMATQCNESGGRLFYAAVLPWRRPRSAVEEMRRVRGMGSAASIFVRGLEWDLPLVHPMFWPIYEEAERQDLVVAIHTGFGSPTISRMFEGMPRPNSGELPFVDPLEAGLTSAALSKHAVGSILGSTLLEDFPRLRWVVLESGSEWLLPKVWGYQRRGRDAAKYFRESRFFVSCEPDEDISEVAEFLGEGCLLGASDWLPTDDRQPCRPEDVWRERAGLSDRTLTKILRENALKLYRF